MLGEVKPDIFLQNAAGLPKKWIHYVQLEEEVYYMYPEEEEEEEEPTPVYQVQSTYRTGKAPVPFGRTPMGPQTTQFGLNQFP